ncbi:unnamed protein product [Mytilus coruscus]|uniref:Integrase catalytic domain-containing protein n=1 Tax=Mytilus coruscus TaxID=42192 RepID=A0A6J8EWQ3_MYTCO|nr:unnamed protein product [Mytilus coruscus]
MIEQLVLPKCLRQDSLLAYHDHTSHTGVKRTYAAIHLKYYWSGMYQEVYNYVTSCDKCQRSKQPTYHRPASLLPLPIEDTLSRWHMDILTCLPKTKDGHQRLLLVIDSFSRWPECFPLKTQEATEIAEVLYNEVFSRFGAPSKLIQALCELFEIQRYHTSSYHPQTNSTCERMNRTIAQTLRTLVAKDQSNWHKLIPSVMMALRMSTNTESTGYSPFQIFFGKEMNLPFDISVQPKDSMSKTAKNHLDTLIDRLKIVKDIAKTSVENSQEKPKNRYDKKAEAPKFRVGDYVMLQSMKVPKGLSPKLHPKWDGPFYVINVGQINTCKLRRCSDHKLIKSRIHTNRMKPYIDPRDHRDIPEIQRNVVDNNRDKVDDIDGLQNDNIDRSQNDAQMQPNDALLQQNDETNDEDHEDNDFKAEELLAKKRRQGKSYYKVKWNVYRCVTIRNTEELLLNYRNIQTVFDITSDTGTTLSLKEAERQLKEKADPDLCYYNTYLKRHSFPYVTIDEQPKLGLCLRECVLVLMLDNLVRLRFHSDPDPGKNRSQQIFTLPVTIKGLLHDSNVTREWHDDMCDLVDNCNCRKRCNINKTDGLNSLTVLTEKESLDMKKFCQLIQWSIVQCWETIKIGAAFSELGVSIESVEDDLFEIELHSFVEETSDKSTEIEDRTGIEEDMTDLTRALLNAELPFDPESFHS